MNFYLRPDIFHYFRFTLFLPPNAFSPNNSICHTNKNQVIHFKLKRIMCIISQYMYDYSFMTAVNFEGIRGIHYICIYYVSVLLSTFNLIIEKTVMKNFSDIYVLAVKCFLVVSHYYGILLLLFVISLC